MPVEFVLFQFGGSGYFGSIVNMINQFGFFLYLFPFLLALAIFWGILNQFASDKLGKGPTALVSLILALFVMLFASFNPAIVGFFANLSGTGLIIGSGILLVIIFLGLAGVKLEEGTGAKHWKTALVLFLILVAILAFLGAGAGQFGLFPSFAGNPQFIAFLFFIVIIGLALWMMTNSGGEGGKKEEGK